MKYLTILLLSVLILLLTAILFPTVPMEYVVHNYISKSIQCGRWAINPFRLGLSCYELSAHIGEKQHSYWEIQIAEVHLEKMSLADLFEQKVFGEGIRIIEPRVKLTEWEPARKPKRDTENQPDPTWDVDIQNIQFSKGTFTYLTRDKKTNRQKGEIEFTDIDLKIPRLARIQQRWQETRAQASGQLDEGKVAVAVNFYPHSSQLDLKVQADHINLANVNSFTVPYSKLKLTGYIAHADGYSDLKGEKLISRTSVNYKDLEVDIIKGQDDSQFVTWFKDAVFNMTLCDEKSFEEAALEKSQVVLSEKTGSWANFILTGLLKSALKAACVQGKVDI